MNIFKQAKKNELSGKGYHASKFVIIWQSKKVSWQMIAINYGIRWSKKIQIFPVWNVSNNSERSLMFGIWKLHFTIIYRRKASFNQQRRLFMRMKLWKFYQLVS